MTDNPNDAVKNQCENIQREAELYEQLVQTEGWKLLEQKINEKLSRDLTDLINTDSSQEAERLRLIVRGTRHTIDLPRQVIATALSIRKTKSEEDEEEEK